MIITLKTTSRDDTSRFSNFFPEGLKIPPNAKIGLVNAAFTVAKGIAISGINNDFDIQIANQDTPTTLTLSAGSYATVADIATEIQNVIQTWVATLSPEIQALFPVAEQTAAVDAQDILTITLSYDPVDLDLVSLNTTTSNGSSFVPQTLNAYADATIVGDSGGYCHPTYIDAEPALRTGDGTNNFALATSRVFANTNTAEFSFQLVAPAGYQQEDEIGLALTYNATLAQCPVQLDINYAASTLDIKENINGTMTSVLDTAPFAFTKGQYINIQVPEIAAGGTGLAVYTHGAVGVAGTTIPLKAGAANRWAVPDTATLMPLWVPATAKIGEIHLGANILKPALYSLTHGQYGYQVGDYLLQTATTGAGTDMAVVVTGVNLGGGVTSSGKVNSFLVVNLGAGTVNGDVVSFGPNTHKTGPVPPDITITIDECHSTNVVFPRGTGYTVGETYDIVHDPPQAGAPTATCTVTAITGAGPSGPLSTINIDTGGYNYVRNPASKYLLVAKAGGAGINAEWEPLAVNNTISVLNNASASLTPVLQGHSPLTKQGNAQLKFNEEELRELLDMNVLYNGDDGLTAVGNGAIAHNNTSSKIIHVQIDEFELESREAQSETAGGPNGKTIGVVCAGSSAPSTGVSEEGFYFKEQFNILYNNCRNPQTVNHNEINVRLTDEENQPFVGLVHPVILTIDIKPDLK